MTTEDTVRLLDLLDILYQSSKPRPRDAKTVAVWREVFRPWSYADVRAATIHRARIARYYPDPSEIAVLLTPPAWVPPPAPVPDARPVADDLVKTERSPVYLQLLREQLEEDGYEGEVLDENLMATCQGRGIDTADLLIFVFFGGRTLAEYHGRKGG